MADLKLGLVGVVLVKHPYPQFRGQTKHRLNNPSTTTPINLYTDIARIYVGNPNTSK
jgi:DNA gyrase/topoisomerase IV subunit B